MKKRVLGLFMALMLGVTSMPTTALAAEADAVSGIAAVETVNNESKGETEGETGENGTEGKSDEVKAEGETGENGTEGKTGEAKAEGETGENGTEGKSDEVKAEGETGENGTEGKTGEGNTEGEAGETNAEGEDGGESALTVQSVQDMIDALPEVDALSEMNEDELNAAYMAVQTAYDAYEGLTAEEQAQITGADCFEALFGWFNGQIAPLADTVKSSYSYLGTQGEWVTRNDVECTVVDDTTTCIVGFWIVQGNVTIDHNLQIGESGTGNAGRLILADGATLTVNGSVLVGNDADCIYAAGERYGKWGTLVINAQGDEPAIKTTDGTERQLFILGGKLVVSSSGRGAENVKLYDSLSGSKDGYFLKCKLNGENNNEWRGNSNLAFNTLVLEGCDHYDEDDSLKTYFDYLPNAAEKKHTKTCTRCGYTVTEACEVDTSSIICKSAGVGGHYELCACGNTVGALVNHTTAALPTRDGAKHTTGCVCCDYTSSDLEDHTWDATGECTVCHFAPVAKDSNGNFYDTVEEALEAAAKSNGTVELYSPVGATEIEEAVEFNQPGATVTLKMAGYTLAQATGSPTLEVEGGTLIIADAATINHMGVSSDTAASAVVVSGGKLIFEDDLTAQGGADRPDNLNVKNRMPAVTASGGEVDFQGDLDLRGGLKITGSATLTNKLTQGTFGKADDDRSVNMTAISVEGSSVYKWAIDLLADGYTGVRTDTKEYVGAPLRYKAYALPMTIVSHEHKFEPEDGKSYYSCACGENCFHEKKDANGFRYPNGECPVCGCPCPHGEAERSWDAIMRCLGCGEEMFFAIQKAGSYLWTYSADFTAAMNNAENGTTIKLLANVEGNRYVDIWDNADTNEHVVTLDLNGYTVTNSGQFFVGDSSGYPGKLIITGNGNVDAPIIVASTGELDLSGWTSGTGWSNGTIKDVMLNPGSKFTGTTGRGMIKTLELGQWKTFSLKGGQYQTILNGRPDEALKLGDLLEKGYAFKTPAGFVEYAAEVQENTSISEGYEVVKCPHDRAENGTCVYCGTTGIAATLDGVVYDDIDKAVEAWLSNGGSLKLYKEYSNADIDFGTASKPLTIDLNGYPFNKYNSMSMNLSGADLTITSSTIYGDSRFGSLTADKGKLKLEGQARLDLNVPTNSTATISLRGGWVHAGDISIPVYKMLDEGCYLLNGNLTVDPTKKPSKGEVYTVGKTDITVDGNKAGEVELGKYRVPIDTTVTVIDENVEIVSFEWYVVNKDGTTAQLAWSAYETLRNDTAAYDVKTDGSKYAETGWKSLERNQTYELLCVVNGMAADGAYQWQTAFQGYELKILPPDLKDAEIEFPSNSNKVAFNPAGATTIEEAYVVKFGGVPLEEGKDYTVVNNSDSANEVGRYTLTIQGVDSQYTGTKTADWEVVPHELRSIVVYSGSKQYDGLADLPKDAVTGDFASAEVGYMPFIQLQEGKDYTLYAAYLKDINAGTEAKDFVVTVTLLNKNYVFTDGSTRDTFTRADYPSNTITVTKATMPYNATDSIDVMNNLAHSYTVDLSAVLQRALGPDSLMEYGAVTYGDIKVDLGSYYDATNAAKIENGKLILPIQAVESDKEEAIGKVTVKVSSTNFEDFTLTIYVGATNKFVPQLDGELTFSPAEITYGDTLDKITISGTMKYDGKVVPGKFTWQYPDYAPGAGTEGAIWIFTPDDDTIYESIRGGKDIKVNRATPTGTPGYTRITSAGKTLADAELSLTGGTLSPADGTLEWIDENGDPLEETTPVEANKIYKWRFKPTNPNYGELTGGIELYHVETATPAPATPAPNPYYIMDGANSNWVLNEDGSMAIRGNGAFSKFTGVKVDGILIDPSNYTVKEGSTIVTLKAEYLNTLSEGNHSFEILWVDGSAATDFTVTGNAADYIIVNAPQTGLDSHAMFWLLLALAILSGLAAGTFKRVKKQQ